MSGAADEPVRALRAPQALPAQRALRVGFLTTLGVNVGDEFIREGIRAALDALNVAYAPLYVNKHDPASLHEPRGDETEPVADKFRDADLFIQSGAPVYWHFQGGRYHSLNSEWHAWMWQGRILNPACADRPVFVNLGAGSCQPWGDRGDSFLADAACRQFAQDAGRRAALTVVRDPVASRMLQELNIDHELLPCPAFLAAVRHPAGPHQPRLIGLNLMSLGGHWDLSGDFDADDWQRRCRALVAALRQHGRIVFICHDPAEQAFARSFAAASERIFVSADFHDFFDVYAACAAVVSNRIHGAVCAAGFGVPALIAGSDTRALMGDPIGLPVHASRTLDASAVARWVGAALANRAAESARLCALRDTTLCRLKSLLSPVVSAILGKTRAALPGERSN